MLFNLAKKSGSTLQIIVDTLSSKVIRDFLIDNKIAGIKLEYLESCKIEFSQYVMPFSVVRSCYMCRDIKDFKNVSFEYNKEFQNISKNLKKFERISRSFTIILSI